MTGGEWLPPPPAAAKLGSIVQEAGTAPPVASAPRTEGATRRGHVERQCVPRQGFRWHLTRPHRLGLRHMMVHRYRPSARGETRSAIVVSNERQVDKGVAHHGCARCLP